MQIDEKQQFGAIQPIIKPFSYQFRGMTDIVEELLFENGCVAYLPESEMQIGTYFDTYGCVSFSFNNSLETVGGRKIELESFRSENSKWLKDNFFKNGKLNFSDRDLVVLSKTNPEKGNDGWSVFLAAKNNGPVPESMNFFNLKDVNYSVNNKLAYYNYYRGKNEQKIADEFNKRFEIKVEWVERPDWQEASKYGALQVYTKAWYQRNGKYYNPTPGQINHAIQMADVEGLKVFDSYDPFLKELEREEDFYYWALKINLIEKPMEKPEIKNNSLVLMVTGPGDVGLFLDGKIIKDNPALILSTWLARNSKGETFSGGPVRSITQEQWNLFEHYNLKMEKL